MKKPILLTLAIPLILSLFGCSSNTQTAPSSAPVLAAPSSTTAPSTTTPSTSTISTTVSTSTTATTSAPVSTTTKPTTTTSISTTQRPSRFDGEKLTVFIDGVSYIYLRHAPGTGSLTAKDRLDQFFTYTHIEGIHWGVYSTEEYPDLSYVLVISGTNSKWTYRLADV